MENNFWKASFAITPPPHWKSQQKSGEKEKNVEDDAKECGAFMFIVQFNFYAICLVCTFLMFYANASISSSSSTVFFFFLFHSFSPSSTNYSIAKVHSTLDYFYKYKLSLSLFLSLYLGAAVEADKLLRVAIF